MRPVRLGVAGAGLIGRAHIERIRASADCILAAIADPTPQAGGYAAALNVPYFRDLAALLAMGDLDGVIIATPNAAHAENAIACIERGLPVLIEKPITDTLETAEQVAAAAGRRGVAVLVGHHRRHSPILARAREVVQGGSIGRMATVTAFVTFLKPDPYFDVAWRREAGGGPVMINLIHAIDDLRFICGEFESLQAMTSTRLRGFPVEDSAVVGFSLAEGGLGTITLSDAAAAPWSWELTAGENPAYPPTSEDCYFIAGTEGALAVPSMRHWRYGTERGWNAPLLMERLSVQRADPLASQLVHFCSVIRGQDRPLIDAADGARTLKATLAVHRAAELGERIML